MLVAVNFHYIRESFDTPYPGIHGITPGQLADQLRLLGQLGEFVSPAQIRDVVRGAGELPARALIVTIDDGLREQYEFAWPILAELRIPALFFINTRPIEEQIVSAVHQIHMLRANMPPAEFVERLREKATARGIELPENADEQRAADQYKYDAPEIRRLKYLLNFTLDRESRDAIVGEMFDEFFTRPQCQLSAELYMDRQQIAELGQRQFIGNHAHEHLPIGQLPRAEMRRQLSRAQDLLSEWAGYRPFALSYPYGSQVATGMEAATIAREEGVEYAFTMERAGNASLAKPLHLARYDNNDVPGGKSARFAADELFERAPDRTWFLD